ncbi:MAG: prepilin-type N-terminal cleavage/methylation domain-containing protein [Deltaproteobacteria bacterium]|nr:prepilin-type N-terminal cleavage/methylation domain-containing protein [Deltaproteobacteria bacterium]
MHRRGFTLMEIMVVLVIIGIVATGAALGFGATTKSQLRSATWMVVSASKYAYSRAVSRGVTVRMVLDFEERSIQLQEASGRVVLNREDETGVGLNRKDSEDVYKADGSVEENSLRDRLQRIGPKVSSGTSGTSSGGDGGATGEGGMASFPVTDVFLKNLLGGTGLGDSSGANSGKGWSGYKGPRFAEIDGNQGKKRIFAGKVGYLQVFSPHTPNVIDKGFAFVYYFPGGTTEHTYIQMSDNDEDEPEIKTVEIHPLNGRAIVHHAEVEPVGDLDDVQEGER